MIEPLPESHVLRRLRVTPLQVVLAMDSDWRGPDLKTLRLRSGLGFHLRRRECLTGSTTCEGCACMRDCWYSFAFDTPRGLLDAPGLCHGDAYAAHPFYFASAPQSTPECLPCLVSLFGRPEALLLKLLGSLEEAGASGNWGARFRVRSVRSPLAPDLGVNGAQLLTRAAAVAWPKWQPPPPRAVSLCRVAFLTPLRLRVKGRVEREPAFTEIARGLFRRIHLLASLYSNAGLENAWMQPLLARAGAIATVESSWRYVREDRTSGRQHSSIPFDGVLGGALLAGDLTPLWPFLEVGQWIGLGASTGHGMGCYAVEGIAAPAPG